MTFLGSFATILVERAVYFYAKERLGFSRTVNLALALAFGAAYVVGALSSHRLARLLGERRLLAAVIGCQVATYGALAFTAGAVALFVGGTLVGLWCGAFWPVVESYVGAGRTPRQALPAVGRFNLAWASAVPLALAAAGPIVDRLPTALFSGGAALWAACLAMAAPLPPRPAHLAADHPERLTAPQAARVGRLLVASRWLLLASYSCLWILAALLPDVLGELGYSARSGAGLSGLLDAVRLGAFAWLGLWPGWHGRVGPLLAAIAALPAGFFLALLGPSLAAVLAGEVVFGLAAGLVYYSALYYAIVAKDASVGAGGGHEGLIGAGFAIGPATGLLAVALTPVLGGRQAGMLVGVGPLLAACLLAACVPLLRLARAGASKS